MRIAVLTFEGFNELKALIVRARRMRSSSAAASARATSCATPASWASGCLGSHYLAAWVIARLAGWKAAEAVVRYVAPVGQKQEYVERARAAIRQYLPRHDYA